MNMDIRWKQRFSNYKKAIAQLTEFVEKPELNKFEVQGLVQCFEYTFELAWKAMKDYLEEQGFDVKSPRSSIQTAFQVQLIKDGYTWIDALEKRNLMAHTYDENLVKEAEMLIRNISGVEGVVFCYGGIVMSFGLKEQDMAYIVSAIRQFDVIKKAVIFGSRAKGNFKPGSDVDIAIFGEGITFNTLSRLHSILEDESPMPYFFDIVDYSHSTHEELKERIDRVGETIFKR